MIDRVYIATHFYDARFTRICVASVRYFYPQAPISLLPGGKLNTSFISDMKRYWNVEVASIAPGEYGWGFVKLEPLFGPPGERFLILDSDTVMVGNVLQLAEKYSADFIVDDDPSPKNETGVYYDWVKAKDEGMSLSEPEFLFNSGQWFGKSGVLTRQDFAGVLEWSFPRKLKYPAIFKNGEQGVLNFVVNEKFRVGKISVSRVPLMRWAGYGLNGLDISAVSSGTAPQVIIHWAGMKKAKLRAMAGYELLSFFEKEYYRFFPAGVFRRLYDNFISILLQQLRFLCMWIRLAYRDKTMRMKALARKIFPQSWQFGRWIPEYLEALAKKRTKHRVQSGPFKGLILPGKSYGSVYTPKLIGCYEKEIHSPINEIIAFRPQLLIDVGAAEGYYAVGLAQKLPSKTRVCAFEREPAARELLMRTAAIYGIGPRLEIKENCSIESLKMTINSDPGNIAIVMDCEGDELSLLDPVTAPKLKRCMILVETHEFKVPGCVDILIERFNQSHEIKIIEQEIRSAIHYPFRSWLTPFLPKIYKTLSVYEHRPTANAWMFFVPKD